MNTQSKIAITILLSLTAIVAGCGGTESPSTGNSASTNASNSNAVVVNSNTANALETQKTPEPATTNAAPTLKPVVDTYYEALKKKDDAMIKSVMSAEFIESVQADMREDKKTSIAAYMAEFDTIPEKPVEVRNEKIEGNNGVAELKGGAYVNWTPFAFVNEGGKWKLTGGSPVLK